MGATPVGAGGGIGEEATRIFLGEISTYLRSAVHTPELRWFPSMNRTRRPRNRALPELK